MTENRTAEEIAEEHDHLLEFGQAIKRLRDAAEDLEENGHTTVFAHETPERVNELLKICANEEHEQLERMMERRSK